MRFCRQLYLHGSLSHIYIEAGSVESKDFRPGTKTSLSAPDPFSWYSSRADQYTCHAFASSVLLDTYALKICSITSSSWTGLNVSFSRNRADDSTSKSYWALVMPIFCMQQCRIRQTQKFRCVKCHVSRHKSYYATCLGLVWVWANFAYVPRLLLFLDSLEYILELQGPTQNFLVVQYSSIHWLRPQASMELYWSGIVPVCIKPIGTIPGTTKISRCTSGKIFGSRLPLADHAQRKVPRLS